MKERKRERSSRCVFMAKNELVDCCLVYLHQSLFIVFCGGLKWIYCTKAGAGGGRRARSDGDECELIEEKEGGVGQGSEGERVEKDREEKGK